MANREVVVLDAVRTPIGRLGGTLSHLRPDDLAAHTLTALVGRDDVDPVTFDEVVFGAAKQSGKDNRNVARMAVLLAGLPTSVPGNTVNRLCASGLDQASASRVCAWAWANAPRSSSSADDPGN